MTKLEFTFKTDTLFKMLFVKYPDLLKQLVAVLLGIQYDSIEQFIITNPEMPPESLGDKFCRLDINEEELANIEALEVPIMSEAVQAYRHVAASPEFREIARLRSKARHDEAQALNNARREEREKLQGLIDKKDAALAEQAGVIDKKDAVLAEQAALIAELQKRLNKK